MEDDGRMSSDEGYAVRAGQDHGESVGDPDLQLDVPALSVEEIELEVEDLQIHLSIQAELADLVKIKVGLDAELGEVKLGIKGVQAEAQLKARLDNVRAIFGEVLASLQHSPHFFRQPSDTGVVEETDDAPDPRRKKWRNIPENRKRRKRPRGGRGSSAWTSRVSRALARADASSSGTSRGPRKDNLHHSPAYTIRRSGRSDPVANKFFKETSAEIISDLLSDARVKRVREYVGGEEFKADRERVRRDAAERLKNIRERYRTKRRDPETAARERELTLRLAEVEAEAADLRIQLSELLEEEEKLRIALDEL